MTRHELRGVNLDDGQHGNQGHGVKDHADLRNSQHRPSTWFGAAALGVCTAVLVWVARLPGAEPRGEWSRVQWMHSSLSPDASMAEGRWGPAIVSVLDGEAWTSRVGRFDGFPVSWHCREGSFEPPRSAVRFPGPPPGVLAFDLLDATVLTGQGDGVAWALIGAGGTDSLRAALAALPTVPIRPAGSDVGGTSTKPQ